MNTAAEDVILEALRDAEILAQRNAGDATRCAFYRESWQDAATNYQKAMKSFLAGRIKVTGKL